MAKKRVGKYPLSFRQMAIERMKDCPSVSALAEELGIFRVGIDNEKITRNPAAGSNGRRRRTTRCASSQTRRSRPSSR